MRNLKMITPAKTVLSVNIIALFFIFLFTDADAQTHIIPRPVKISLLKGHCLLKAGSVIGVDSSSKLSGLYLQNYLAGYYGLHLKLRVQPAKAAISLISEKNKAKGAYVLKVTPFAIKITGNDDGVFYGIQSLIQLLSPASGGVSVTACHIDDSPRFEWRGLSLDVSRHFFAVDEVKKYIDMMAHYKLNVFHWHLTDDEGWRIQVDKYPRLTEFGSKISYWEKQGKFRKLDNLIDGGRDGFYTKDDIKDVIKYAQDRSITILPEIEMPGHSEAAIFAYPELGCKDSTGAQHRVRMLDPSEYTFKFLENVLTEVIDLFPGEYIHIGGDEAEMADWLKSPTAVALMKKEHLKNEREVQSYFIKRIEKFLISKNRKLIGWDEILEGGLAPSATVMSWQGEDGGIMAAKMHHHVVMTPLPQMYFDAPQAKASTEPIGWNPPVTWQMVYNYEPKPAILTAGEADYILGAQANIWTEKIPDMKHLEYMVYPRILAVAELTWTPKDDKNIGRFEQSMYKHYDLFKRWNLNARLPNASTLYDVVTNKDVIDQPLTYPLKNAVLKYLFKTGSAATDTIKKLFPVAINIPLKDDSLTAYAYIIKDQQHILQTAIYRKIKLNPSEPGPANVKYGLQYTVYKTPSNNYNKLDTVKYFTTGVMEKVSLISPFAGPFNSWVKVTGYLRIDKEDDYRLSSDFEWSPLLYLDDKIVLYRDKNKYVEPQVAILHLKKGIYPVKAYYLASFQNSRQMPFNLKDGNGAELETSAHLFH